MPQPLRRQKKGRLNMKKSLKTLLVAAISVILALMLTAAAFAAGNAPAVSNTQPQSQTEGSDSQGAKAIAAAICVGFAAGCGAIGMAMVVSKTNEGISRQPEASGSLRTTLMLGLVFIETAIIYALIVAILVIFVL